MRRKRTIILQRVPIFLGTEGRSETGYGALLSRIARETAGIHIHIHVDQLQPGAGDPLELVKRAIQKISELERRREKFMHKTVLIDVGQPQKNEAAARLAAETGIGVIWQRPDYEALLLRHLDGCQQLRPPAGASLGELRNRWPDYEKGLTAAQLSEKIGLDHVRRACAVENELRFFLTAIGLI
jgi:hypothetical protein